MARPGRGRALFSQVNLNRGTHGQPTSGRQHAPLESKKVLIIYTKNCFVKALAGTKMQWNVMWNMIQGEENQVITISSSETKISLDFQIMRYMVKFIWFDVL